jgi:hypothetical protein
MTIREVCLEMSGNRFNALRATLAPGRVRSEHRNNKQVLLGFVADFSVDHEGAR